VVDLSADFRLADTAAYARWYGVAPESPLDARPAALIDVNDAIKPIPVKTIKAELTQIGNATKALPWQLLVGPTANVWILMAICLVARFPPGYGWVGAFTARSTSVRFIGLLRTAGRGRVKVTVGRGFRLEHFIFGGAS
jgi:hypothetical protein